MKPNLALSLRQPWADFVLYFGKHVENRTWNFHNRGEFWIHAAKGMTKSEYEDAMMMLEEVTGCPLEKAELLMSMERGGIVGRARLVGVEMPRTHKLHGIGRVAAEAEHLRVDWRWHFPDQYGFVLADVVSVPFVPCKGYFGFFPLPDDVVEKLKRAA